MKQRILTACGLVALLVLMFVSRIWTLYVFDVCVGLIIIVASMEMSKLLARMGLYNYTTLAGCFPSLLYLLVGLLLLKNVSLLYIFAAEFLLIIATFLLTFVVSLFFRKRLRIEMDVRSFKKGVASFALRKATYTLITFLYPAFLCMFLIFSNRIESFSSQISGITAFAGIDLGLLVLLCSFLIPIISDTSAMFTGMVIKGPKLFPKISPNKTISGFVGGVVWTTLVLCALFFVFSSFDSFGVAFSSAGISLVHFALLGFFGSIVSTAGDLFESFLKRKALVKDSGKILPGHGGVLDRFDSHIFSSAFVFLFFVLILI